MCEKLHTLFEEREVEIRRVHTGVMKVNSQFFTMYVVGERVRSAWRPIVNVMVEMRRSGRFS